MLDRSTIAQIASVGAALGTALLRQDMPSAAVATIVLVAVVVVVVGRRSLRWHAEQQQQQLFGVVSPSEQLNQILQQQEEVEEMIKKASTPAKAPAKGRAVKEGTALQAEAFEINGLLRDAYGIPAYVDFRRQSSIVETPRHILYKLDQRKPFPMGMITSRLDDMGRDIHRYARKGKGAGVTVTLMDSQPPYLMVSRPEPQPHLWANRQWKRRPLSTCLGDHWVGPQRVPLVLDIEGKSCTIPAGLFCGQPRSGKSRTLHAALLGLLESTPPSKLHVWCIETKTNAYSIYAGLPHVKQVTGSMSDVLPILEQFAHWCTAEGAPTDGVHRLLLFDEFQDAIEDDEIGEDVEKLVKRIMAKGPERGLRTWLATQVPDKDCYPGRLKSLTHFKVVATIENDGYLKQIFQLHGANRLQPQREFIWAADGQQRVVTSFWLSDDDISAEISSLRAKWGGANAGQKAPTTIPTTWGRGGAEVGQNLGQKKNQTPRQPGAEVGQTGGAGVSTRVGGVCVEDFPLQVTRPLTDDECLVVANLAANGLSKNQLQSHVYGGTKNSKKGAYITQALERAEVLNGKA